MKQALPFLSLLMAATAGAQPVLNLSDVQTTPGPTGVITPTAYVAPGPTGANFMFDVSLSQAGTPVQAQLVLPSSTPYASHFPQATLASAAFTNPSLYVYESFNANSCTNWGTYGPTSSMVYSDGEKTFQFPLTNGMTWTDNVSGLGNNSGQAFTRTGTITCTYNGYGTLVMPFGTFTNVIRFEIGEELHDDFDGVVTTISTTHTVSYIKPGVETALFSSSEVYTGFEDGGDPTLVGSFSSMIAASEVGITELQGQGPSALLMPNPASDEFAVVMDQATSPDRVSITLLDATGREVRMLQPLSAVETRQTFTVGDLPRGLYLVRIADAQGRTSTSHLVLD